MSVEGPHREIWRQSIRHASSVRPSPLLKPRLVSVALLDQASHGLLLKPLRRKCLHLLCQRMSQHYREIPGERHPGHTPLVQEAVSASPLTCPRDFPAAQHQIPGCRGGKAQSSRRGGRVRFYRFHLHPCSSESLRQRGVQQTITLRRSPPAFRFIRGQYQRPGKILPMGHHASSRPPAHQAPSLPGRGGRFSPWQEIPERKCGSLPPVNPQDRFGDTGEQGLIHGHIPGRSPGGRPLVMEQKSLKQRNHPPI